MKFSHASDNSPKVSIKTKKKQEKKTYIKFCHKDVRK